MQVRYLGINSSLAEKNDESDGQRALRRAESTGRPATYGPAVGNAYGDKKSNKSKESNGSPRYFMQKAVISSYRGVCGHSRSDDHSLATGRSLDVLVLRL